MAEWTDYKNPESENPTVDEVLNQGEEIQWEDKKNKFLTVLTSPSHEGGYVFDKKDPGGETNWGITRDTATELGYKGEMKDLSREEAIEMYKLSGRELSSAEVNFGKNEFTFKMADIGINAGPKIATQIMQKSLNLFGKNVDEDGLMGPSTRKAFDEVYSSPTNRKLLMDSITNFQLSYYQGDEGFLKKIDPEVSNRFIRGWATRAGHRYTDI